MISFSVMKNGTRVKDKSEKTHIHYLKVLQPTLNASAIFSLIFIIILFRHYKVALYTYISVNFCTKNELFFLRKYFIIIGDKKG